jgi:hypothetical protein
MAMSGSFHLSGQRILAGYSNTYVHVAASPQRSLCDIGFWKKTTLPKTKKSNKVSLTQI